jgi:hypothetical protein
MTIVKEEYLKYLTELEEWGVKDMSKSLPYLQKQFPELSLEEARAVLKTWSATKYQTLNEGCEVCRL